jgi:hypothetical protein
MTIRMNIYGPPYMPIRMAGYGLLYLPIRMAIYGLLYTCPLEWLYMGIHIVILYYNSMIIAIL